MATYSLSPLFNGWQGFNAAGQPLNLGTIDVFLAGTSTPTPTWTTQAASVTNSNPITLNNGFPPNQIWLQDGVPVKFVVKDAAGATIGTDDNVASMNDLLAQLANTSDAAKGAGLVGINQTLAYAANTVGYNLAKRQAVFGTGVAATDDSALQAAITAAPTMGVVDLFGVFASSTAKTLKPQLMIRNGGGAIINHTNTATNCFEYIPGGSAGFPGQIVVDGLAMNGPWTSGAETLGTQTWANIKAAVFINANAPFCRVVNCDIRSFFAQVLLRNCYQSRVSGYFYGGVHGVMLYASQHDTLLDDIECDGNLRTGLSVNYGNPATYVNNAQSIQMNGGACQYNDVGVWLESCQGFSVIGTLYCEGNRIRDMQIGVGDSGAYLRTANFTRVQGIGTSSAVPTASVAPLYARPQGANIEVAHSQDVYLRGMGFYSGTPTTTEHIIVDGYCDRTLIEPAFLTSTSPYKFDSPDRVVTQRAGRTNFAQEQLNGLTYGTHGSATPVGRGPYTSSAGTPSGRQAIIVEALTALTDVIFKALAGSGQIRFMSSTWAELFSVDFVNGRLNCYVPIVTKVYTVATLPTPSSTIPPGSRAMVSDANSTTFNAVVAAGGANTVPVFVDGAGNWRIG
jgi:hypothetical protein